MKYRIIAIFWVLQLLPPAVFAETTNRFSVNVFDIVSLFAVLLSAYLAFKVAQLSKESTIKSFKEKRYYHLNDLFGQYLGTIDNLFQKDMRILQGKYKLLTDTSVEAILKKASIEYEERASIAQSSTILYRKIEIFGLDKHKEAKVLKNHFSLAANFFIKQINLARPEGIDQNQISESLHEFNQLVQTIQCSMKEILNREWAEIESFRQPLKLNSRVISILITSANVIICLVILLIISIK